MWTVFGLRTWQSHILFKKMKHIRRIERVFLFISTSLLWLAGALPSLAVHYSWGPLSVHKPITCFWAPSSIPAAQESYGWLPDSTRHPARDYSAPFHTCASHFSFTIRKLLRASAAFFRILDWNSFRSPALLETLSCVYRPVISSIVAVLHCVCEDMSKRKSTCPGSVSAFSNWYSIEGKSTSGLRPLASAPHVKR